MRLPRLLLVLTLALLALVGHRAVHAQDSEDGEDIFSLAVRWRVEHDDNLFRLPPGAMPAASTGSASRSERTDVRSVLMALDKHYSLQHFRVNVNYVDYHHQNFTYLNFGAFNYAAVWDWSLTPRVHGTVSTDRRESLNSFADFRSFNVRNVRTDNTYRFSGEANLGAAVRVLTTLDQVRRSNDLPVLEEGDYTINSAGLGLRYQAPSGNSVNYRFRHGAGDYFNRVANAANGLINAFDEDEHEIRANWAWTGKTALNARLAHLQRTHPGQAQRNFSGPVGEMGVNWQVSARTSIGAVVSRSLYAYQSDNSSYVIGNRISLSPTYRATAHTSVRLNYSLVSQDYKGSSSALIAPSGRQDTIRSALLAVDWRPRQLVLLTLAVQSQRRASNQAGSDFTATAVSVAAQLNF